MAERKIISAEEAAAQKKASSSKKKTVKATDEAEEKVESAKKKVVEAAEKKPAPKKKPAKAEVEEAAEEAVEETTEEVKPKTSGKKIKKPDGSEVNVKPAAPVKGKEGALKYRIGAVALWVVAIVFEVLAVLFYANKIPPIGKISTIAEIIIALVLDLACVSVGSILWKKANRFDPASKSNKVKFWLWNNMGVIATALAFIPFIIIALTDKNADKKTKTIATVVAVIALLIGGLISYDWNPISQEEKDEAIETLGDTVVYWTPFGTVYHTDENCSHLNHSDTLVKGTVEQAIEANRPRICKDCERRDNEKLSEESADKSEDIELPVIDDTEEATVDEAA